MVAYAIDYTPTPLSVTLYACPSLKDKNDKMCHIKTCKKFRTHSYTCKYILYASLAMRCAHSYVRGQTVKLAKR